MNMTMREIVSNEQAAEAKYRIESELLGLAGAVVYVNGEPAGTVERRNFDFGVEWGKLIAYIWDDDRSRSWRVTAFDAGGGRIELLATNGPGQREDRIEVRYPGGLAGRGQIDAKERRREFAEALADGLKRRFPRASVTKVTTGAAPRLNVPGRYARVAMKIGGEEILAIGVSGEESQADIDSVVAAGIVWAGGAGRRVRLIFCLPEGKSRTALERLSMVDPARLGARFDCLLVDEAGWEFSPVVPYSQGELLNRHPGDLEWPDRQSGHVGRGLTKIWRERIAALAPGLIEARPGTGSRGEGYFIHGLEFARSTARDGTIVFGVAGSGGATVLTEATFGRLGKLVAEIAAVRRADSPDRRHPFYRLRAEGWLESLLRRDIRSLDLAFDDRYVYSQIPTWKGDERSIIDLLTVREEDDSSFRLAIIEIKAAEDAQLPLQGLDYWLRIEQARVRREFERRGMFRGVRISDKPPLLYLVAPALRFHRTFDLLAGCISDTVEAWRVGINSNWREVVRVRSIARLGG